MFYCQTFLRVRLADIILIVAYSTACYTTVNYPLVLYDTKLISLVAAKC